MELLVLKAVRDSGDGRCGRGRIVLVEQHASLYHLQRIAHAQVVRRGAGDERESRICVRERACVDIRGGRGCAVHLSAIHDGTEHDAAAEVIGREVLEMGLHEVHLGQLPPRRGGGVLPQQAERLLRRDECAVPNTVGRRDERVFPRDRALIDFLTCDERVAVVPLIGEEPTEQNQAFAAAGGRVEAREGAEAHSVGTCSGGDIAGVDEIGVGDLENLGGGTGRQRNRGGHGRKGSCRQTRQAVPERANEGMHRHAGRSPVRSRR